MARARNQPRGHLALLVFAVLALLVALCARVNAAPDPALLDDDDAADAAADVPVGIADAPVVSGRARGANDNGTRSSGADAPLAGDAPGAPFAPFVPFANDAPSRARAGAPDVAQVVAAAWRAAGVAEDPAPGWRLRTRLAALVPWVTVRDGDDASWREVVDPTLGHTQVFEVRATWHLDRLLFEPSELRIAALDVGRRRVRQRVATLATRLYFAWLRARAAAGWEAEELAAELDAVTDGKFSEMLRKRAEVRR